jgi:hypothetical protein
MLAASPEREVMRPLLRIAPRFALVLVAALSLSIAPRADAATYQAPATIPSDCSADVTQPLLSWIASVPDNSVLSFATGGCYRIEGTLELINRNGLTVEGNGATFKATTTGDSWRSQWRVVGGSQFVFRNMTVRGGSPSGGTFVSSLQWQHAFDIRGVAGIEIDRAAASDLYGDCVYVGQGWDSSKYWSSNVRVHDSTCARNGRMGVAVTAGRDVRVETSSFSQIALSVFDVEPNGAGFGAQNIAFTNNQVGSAYDYVFVATGDGPVDGVTVSFNTLIGKGMHMGVFAPVGQRRSNMTITGNVSDAGYYEGNGAAMYFVRVDGLTVTNNTAPLSGPNMALVSGSESCNVNVSGNSYPGGVEETRISPYSCGQPAPTPTPDTPTVTLTSPADGATLSGNRATITANASTGVTRMELYIDGALKATSSTTAISTNWNLRKVAAGAHTITARAYDAANHMGSHSITVYR